MRDCDLSLTLPQLERFCRQYLQVEHTLDYPDPDVLCRQDVQRLIHERLFSDLVTFQPPPRYKMGVLKEILRIIEGGITDWDEQGISDSLMDRLAELLSSPIPSELTAAQQRSYVTYHLSLLAAPKDDTHRTITLLESRSLVAASGTTGLRTWEAALHLGQYLCANPSLVQDKRILELGAGTGYLSILCARQLGAAHVLASDGSAEVVAALPDNFYLNWLHDVGFGGDARVAATELRWGHALVGTEEAEWNGGRVVDVVLGADITYDASVVGALAGTIADVFGLHPHADVIIAATQRNEVTFEAFLEACQAQGFTVEDLMFEVPPRADQMGPFYNDRVRIRTCRVKSGQAS